MAVFHQSEDRLRLKRVMAEQAINLAMKSRWQEAVDINRQYLEQFPKDVDAYNRLGKALMETGRYDEARDAYATALKLDPVNTIASKNLQRLSKLAEENATPRPTKVDPSVFIEESGKTVLTTLVDVAAPEVLAKLDAGDPVELSQRQQQVYLVDEAGQDVGRLEPKLAKRLIKLLEMGNQYSATVTAADETSVKVIIRETYRDAKMGNRPSFPMVAPAEGFRSYIKDSVLKYDIDELDEEIEDDEREHIEGEDADSEAAEPELGLDSRIEDTELHGDQD